MQVVADLHIHSRFSRACSSELNFKNIAQWCFIKGVQLVATGDFCHPAWFKEIKEQLVEDGHGFLELADGSSRVKFILGNEVSCIYKQGEQVRRVHLCLFFPALSDVAEFNRRLEVKGCNIHSDGRPILGLSAKELLKIMLEINPAAMMIPAHAWTPWFAIFGSKSGFDSFEECFEELTPQIFAIETGLSCYDKKTEVLTKDGWKKFSEVKYKDKFCTLNLKTNNIEFQNPTKIHNYNYQGRMYRLKTKRVDLLVTPNHKLLYAPCDFRKPARFFLKEAEFLFNKSKRFKKDGIWAGENIKYFTLSGVKIKHGSLYYSGWRYKKEKRFPINPWLKFFGFWTAEGWTTGGKNGDYDVCLSNKDSALLFEMKEILESFSYNVSKKKDGVIRVRDYQLYHYLKQFGKSYEKFIPPEIKFLSRDLLEIFLEYYLRGDGHRYGRNGKGTSATTISVRLRDDLQEVALKIGISAYYKRGNPRGTPITSLPSKKQYKQSHDAWIVYFIRKNLHAVLPSTNKKYGHTESWVNFDGPVYCATVPNHVIYVRRNGIPIWCGNSDPPMNWRLSALDNITLVSNSDAHSLPNIGREANILEMSEAWSYAELREILKTKNRQKFIKTLEFYPEEGMYHYDGHRSCGVVLMPPETKRHGNLCPVCKKPLTIGVLHRVVALADRPENFVPEKAIPFNHLVGLDKIIADSLGVKSRSSPVAQRIYRELIAAGSSELKILLDLNYEDLAKFCPPAVAEGIRRVRESRVRLEAGFDGQYGRVIIFSEEEKQATKQQKLL